jgi:diacylglycerol kinase (ATP)
LSEGRKKDVLTPFRAAMAGIAYTFRTQRHMRFHIFTVLVVFLAAIYMHLALRDSLVLLLMVSLVLIAEMFNSAIEATVDLVQPTYHPLARFAKDISAGAVLITTIISLAVGGLLILGENRWEEIRTNLSSSVGTPFMWRVIFGMMMLMIIVIIGKGLGQRGQVLKGGLVSGHSAFAFFFAMAAVFVSDNAIVSAIAILLAAIVAQSRWEAKIHSIVEISLGAGVGVVLGLVLFGLAPK